ncbi:MAG: TRAP transporter substrate-binding protein DctP [Bacteroidota bacterium]
MQKSTIYFNPQINLISRTIIIISKKISSLVILTLLILCVPSYGKAQQYLIKFATLAPDGSTWMNVMKEYDQAVRKESGGRLGFKMYPGQIQGDEKDVLRKIRNGQLHSAGVTGNGLTEIAPKARILDSPFLFESYDEVDHVYQTFNTEFNQAFDNGGYVLLGWAEVGFVYVFTNTPVNKPEDMKGVKMWLWEGDPVAEASFKALSINPIPLSITDVLTSLQTGLIDGVYTAPLAAVALQWFTRVKYMMDYPLADAAGAVIISKKKFNEMPPDIQEILTRNGKIYMAKLTKLSREDNAKAIATLKKQGIQMIPPASQNVITQLQQTGERARQFLASGRLKEKGLTPEFVKRVETAIEDFRKGQKKNN